MWPSVAAKSPPRGGAPHNGGGHKIPNMFPDTYSGTSSFGAPPKNRNMRTCAPVQSGSVCVQVAPGSQPRGEVRGAEHGDENLRLVDLSRYRIGDPDPLARIVDERLLPGEVVLAHHWGQPPFEATQQIAEAAVAVGL